MVVLEVAMVVCRVVDECGEADVLVDCAAASIISPSGTGGEDMSASAALRIAIARRGVLWPSEGSEHGRRSGRRKEGKELWR